MVYTTSLFSQTSYHYQYFPKLPLSCARTRGKYVVNVSMSHTRYWHRSVIKRVYKYMNLSVVTIFSTFMACTFEVISIVFLCIKYPRYTHKTADKNWKVTNYLFSKKKSYPLHPIPCPTHALPHSSLSFPLIFFLLSIHHFREIGSSSKTIAWKCILAYNSREKVHNYSVTCLQFCQLKAKCWILCKQHNRSKKSVACTCKTHMGGCYFRNYCPIAHPM